MTLLSSRMSILRDGRKIVREGKGSRKETEKQLEKAGKEDRKVKESRHKRMGKRGRKIGRKENRRGGKGKETKRRWKRDVKNIENGKKSR